MSLTDDLMKFVGIKPRFPHVERELATTYGLAAAALKAVRDAHLTRPQHWDLVKGLVCYNDEGKAALEGALGIGAQKNPAANPAPPAAETPPAPTGLRALFADAAQALGSGPAPDSAPNDPPPTPTLKKFVAPKAGEVRILVAVAIVRNRRILKARDQDRVAWVRVRNSRNFRPGMELKARFVAGEQWDLEGRSPRWGGKY